MSLKNLIGNFSTYSSRDHLVAELKGGVVADPHLIPKFVEVLIGAYRKAKPTWPAGRIRNRALENLAIYALMADHGNETELWFKGRLSNIGSVEDWYRAEAEYGPAMRLITEYVGARGDQFVKLILEDSPDRAF
jgi:hypothetical protein